MYTGYGLVMGAALGLLVGTILGAELWWVIPIGTALGLIAGAVVDAKRASDHRG